MSVLFHHMVIRWKRSVSSTHAPPSHWHFLPPRGHYFCANAIKGQWLPRAWQSRAEQRGCHNLRSHNNHYSPPPILTLRQNFLCFLPPTPIVPSVTLRRAASLQWDSPLGCNKKTTGLDLQCNAIDFFYQLMHCAVCVAPQHTLVVLVSVYLQTWSRLSKQWRHIYKNYHFDSQLMGTNTFSANAIISGKTTETDKTHNSFKHCTCPRPSASSR